MFFNRFLFFCLLFLASHIQAAVVISGVRIWSAPERTRLVFDISKPVEHKLFILKNPNRVVIDLKNTKFRGTFSRFLTNDHFIQFLRHAPRNRTNYRIVLDLKQTVRSKSFLLKPNKRYGHRLVIDLEPKKRKKKPTISFKTHSSTVQPPLKNQIIIAIDAGHGGDDPGAKGPTGALEKKIVLQIAKKLKRTIDREKGMSAFLTRKGDYFVDLRKRMELAREGRADLFVSIHADSFRKSSANGSSVYILSNRGASSEAARWLAKSENLSDLLGGVVETKNNEVNSILLDLSQKKTKEASLKVAKSVYNAMKKINRMHAKKVQKAGFVVLKSPDIPSILIETAFISNRKEEQNLRSRRHQQKIATAIYQGIKNYFKKNPPPNSAWASRQITVKYGDTLSGIAVRYHVKQRDIKKLNKMRSSHIRVGQRLRIPKK